MSRVDIPVLECDRCKSRTSDKNQMAAYIQLTRSHVGGNEQFDLCSPCAYEFKMLFMECKEVEPKTRSNNTD